MCNFRKIDNCFLHRQCLIDNSVYGAEVDVKGQSKMKYIGSTEGAFKSTNNNHVISFTMRRYCNSTTLTKHVYRIKDEKKFQRNIRWWEGRMRITRWVRNFVNYVRSNYVGNIDISIIRRSIKGAGIMTRFFRAKKYLICNMELRFHSLPGKNKQKKTSYPKLRSVP